jgi:hypothetical protein
MNHLAIIPDSTSEHEDQREYGYFIKKGKYYITEYRKEDSVTKELSNFVMQIEFHLVNGTNNSKRIIKIQRNTGEVSIIEVYSSEMKPDSFETILKSKRCTFLGSAYQLKIVFSHLMDQEKEAVILSTLGWNNELDLYVFADSVYSGNKILKVDDIGIIQDGDKRYYLPAFGLANDSSEDFEVERRYSFRAGKIDFAQWSTLVMHSFGPHGAIGILFLILAVFRDIVFKEVRFFPFLFLFGEWGTGKTSYVEMYLSLFGSDTTGTPLNNSTSVALSRIVSTRVNSLFYFKEYTSETDEKAQDFILTAYDGAGRTTGIKSTDNKTKCYPVRSGLIFDGNQLPTQKAAVLSRMVLMNFEESKYTSQQREAFNKLKSEAESGLGSVLLEILANRSAFEKDFRQGYNAYISELKNMKQFSFSERTLNHIALLMTPAKILWNHLPFPFELLDVWNLILENAEYQHNLIKQSGTISVFWEAFSNSFKKGLIVCFDGLNAKFAHFNIKTKDDCEGIIQIKLPGIYPNYVRYCRENNITFLDQNSLRMIITSKANREFISGTQKGRGAAYTDKYFGTCYQFSFKKIESSIFISDIEINM